MQTHDDHRRQHKSLALVNARLIDPATGLDAFGGLLISGGVIADLGMHITEGSIEGAEILDCGGRTVAPGLIDMMVFAGEPGHEHRETLATASRAAAAGGVTTILCMPNTDPVIDDVALVDFILRRARDTALVHVHPMAAMTRDLKGEEMAEIGLLREAGAVAFTNGKTSVANARLMRNVLAYANDFGALIVHHLEDATLTQDGVMNEGEVATRLGLRGIPTAAETIMLERDIRLVELTGGPLPRGADLLPRLARRHSRRQGARAPRHLRRLHQSSHPQRERHRLLPHLLQNEAAAPRRGRPARHGRGRGERRYRRDRLRPRSTRRRRQAPALRRGQ